MRDDGPSPGNGTSQDRLTIRAEFVADVKEKNVEVKNVEPDLVGVPSIFYHESNGERFAVVSFAVTDPGMNDVHTATLTWSDDVVTEGSGFIRAYTCSYVFTKIFSRTVLPGVQVSIKSLVVRDDDLGVTRRFRENLELDANDDDDNLNLQEDLSDSGFNDDDLKSINLQQLITPGMDLRRGTRYLHYNPSSVRVWDSQSKGILIPNGRSITNQDQVWVEGVSASRSEISIQWNTSEGVGCSVLGSITGNVIDVIVTKQMLDLDTDSDNTGIVDRSDYEDSIENTAGKGKKLFKRSSPAETVLDTNAFVQSTGYALTLTVSPGLNAWADAAKTTRITSANSSSIPSDDRQSETYTWTSWVGVFIVFIEGTEVGERTASLKLVGANSSTSIDTVRFIVDLQNKIFVAVDGTGSQAWLSSPEGRTHVNPFRWNSHSRNLYDEMNDTVKYARYWRGPNDYLTGFDSQELHDEAFNYIYDKWVESDRTAKIALVGWSRGAAVVLWVANDLSDLGISVDFVGLYDPVDMAYVIPDDESFVAPLIDRVAVIGPGPSHVALNWDYPTFIRMSHYGTIRPELWNSHTIIAHSLIDSSHGGIGGAPGYNDVGLRSWGEAVNVVYNYALDRINSIRADELVRGGLRAEGWDVRDVSGNEYGFPLNNPSCTTGFWQSLVGNIW